MTKGPTQRSSCFRKVSESWIIGFRKVSEFFNAESWIIELIHTLAVVVVAMTAVMALPNKGSDERKPDERRSKTEIGNEGGDTGKEGQDDPSPADAAADIVAGPQDVDGPEHLHRPGYLLLDPSQYAVR